MPASHVRWGRYALTIIAAGAPTVAGGAAEAALALHDQGHGAATAASSQPSAGPAASVSPADPLAKAATAALPSVVSITVTTSQMGRGSGVILRSDGTIVTNTTTSSKPRRAAQARSR